jgi:hypothetical protein
MIGQTSNEKNSYYKLILISKRLTCFENMMKIKKKNLKCVCLEFAWYGMDRCIYYLDLLIKILNPQHGVTVVDLRSPY